MAFFLARAAALASPPLRDTFRCSSRLTPFHRALPPLAPPLDPMARKYSRVSEAKGGFFRFTISSLRVAVLVINRFFLTSRVALLRKWLVDLNPERNPEH